MARTWLSRIVKQGMKMSLIARATIGEAGQLFSNGWNNLVNEARAEHDASRVRRAAETAEAMSIRTASQRLKQAEQAGERTRSASARPTILEPAKGADKTVASPLQPANAHDETSVIEAASERLDRAAHAGKRKRDQHGSLLTTAEADTTYDDPVDMPTRPT